MSKSKTPKMFMDNLSYAFLWLEKIWIN